MERPPLPASKPPPKPKDDSAAAAAAEVKKEEASEGTGFFSPEGETPAASATTDDTTAAATKSDHTTTPTHHHESAGGVSGAVATPASAIKTDLDFESSCMEKLPQLLVKTEQAFQAAKEAHAFFKKRVDAENNYAKSLAQVYKETATLSMVKKFVNEQRLADKEIGPSLRRGWLAIEEQTQFECQGRHDFATKLQQEVVEPLAAWIKETEPHRKKLQADGNRRYKEICEANLSVNRLKEALDRTDGTLPAAALAKTASFKDRMASMVAKKVPTSRDQIEAEYHVAAAAAGEARLRYNAEVPGILRELNKLETARMEILQKSLKAFLDLQVVSFMGFQENWPTVHATVSEADPKTDIAEFIAAMQAGAADDVVVNTEETAGGGAE